MRFLKYFAGAGLAALLVACGGGGAVGGGNNPGTGSTSTAASITLTSSAANISTAAGATNATVTITAEVRNASGTGVSGEPITFTVDSGALTNASTSTGIGTATGGALGRATAVLSAGTDKTPRNITVTVVVGTVTNKIVVPVVSSATSIEVLSSAVSLPSGSDSSVTITALVKNSANNGIADEPVKFSADSGVLQNAASVTGVNGTATALLSVGADKTQRNITVTVTTGAISKSIVVPVSGTTLSITGPSSLLVGGGASYTATLKDSNGGAVAGVEVQATSALGNTLTPAKATTDNNGTATFQYAAVKSGADTFTISGAGVSARQLIAISTVNFGFTSPSPGVTSSVAVNTPQVVTVRYLSNGIGVSGQDVFFSSTRGEVSPTNVKTDANGYASTTASASTAGPATVSALLGSSSTVATASINYYAIAPASIVLQANPSAVRPNAIGTSANTAVLSAVVRDSSGNAVQGAVVNFTLVADTSGGTISPGTGVSDANGRVTASFIPGATTTAARGVQVRASTGNGLIASTANLTVSNQALFIAIATSNTITNKPDDDSVYSKPFSVQVNDANGAAVANQAVTLAIYPPTYRKGRLGWNGTSWTMIPALIVQCPNEDVDRTGILGGNNRDTDGNGALTPGLPGVIAPASVVTDSSGFATFNVLYGEQYVPWIDFEITARALVAGTESSNTFFYPAAGLASDFTNETSAPAGVVSPFNLTRPGPDGQPLDNASRTSACNGSLN